MDEIIAQIFDPERGIIAVLALFCWAMWGMHKSSRDEERKAKDARVSDAKQYTQLLERLQVEHKEQQAKGYERDLAYQAAIQRMESVLRDVERRFRAEG